MVIKRIRKIKAKAITDIVDQNGPYFEVSNYDVKKKLDELVDSMNKVIEYLAKAELQKCDHLHGIEKFIVVDPEIPVNEDGHDEACSSGIGQPCDCWANSRIRKQSEQAIVKMKGK